MSMDMSSSIVRDLKGNIVTVADLPSPDIYRWTPNLKVIVILAVRSGLITLEQVLNRYHMTMEEFVAWERGYESHGAAGLKVTQSQKRRNPR